MKILVCEFKQESNSFNPILTDWDAFERLGILRGEELFQGMTGLHLALKGIVDGIYEYGGQVVPGIVMCSGSGGPVCQEVVDRFLEEVGEVIRKNLPLDGVFLSLHGATLAEASDDVCGDILADIRSKVGPAAIISASCDMHANITKRMLENADFFAGFHTYPHVDFYETGYRAACLGMKKLRGAVLKQFCTYIPMIAPPGNYTTDQGKIHELMQYGDWLKENKGLEDYSVFQVQPWLDIPEIASAVLTISANEAMAEQSARELAKCQFELRDSLVKEYASVGQVIKMALENKCGKPVILVDSADSPNAGATCDSAQILMELLPYADDLSAAFPINDPEAVEKAFRLGIGAEAVFSLGGKLAPKLNKAIEVKCKVISLHGGEFLLEGPANRGGKCDVGKSAVLMVGKIKVLVCNYATKIGDPQFYRGFGVEPTLCDLVVIKACTSFRAAYEPIAAMICNAQTFGAANSDLKALPYRRLPKPTYPFQEIEMSDVVEPRSYR